MSSDAQLQNPHASAADLKALASALERAADALHAAAREAERTARPSSRLRSEAPPERRLLTVSQAATALSLSRSKVYAYVLSGELPSITLGRSRRIPAAALADWIERRQAELS